MKSIETLLEETIGKKDLNLIQGIQEKAEERRSYFEQLFNTAALFGYHLPGLNYPYAELFLSAQNSENNQEAKDFYNAVQDLFSFLNTNKTDHLLLLNLLQQVAIKWKAYDASYMTGYKEKVEKLLENTNEISRDSKT